MRWRRRQPPRVEFDAEGVRRLRRDKVVESVRWEDLSTVDIRTTGDGPFAEDVFWLLSGRCGGGVAVPQGLMPDGLLERLQALPGFHNEAVVDAMATAGDGLFPCWEGTSGPTPEAP